MEKLQISDNGRYFVTADGKPFTWIADTVWTMPQRLKWDDADYLMKKRKSQGFTVLQIVALDPEQDIDMHSPAGEKALIDDDLSKPNEEYFKYLDWILDRAEFYGFYVLLLPVWGQLVVGDNWLGQTFEKIVTEENAYPYGQWIGERYRARKNILWCLGGDRQPIHKGVDYKNVWRRMAEGLAKGLTGADLAYNQKDSRWKEIMITYHSCHEMETGECSTMSYWDDGEAWISFIMLQSGHGAAPKNYALVTKEYQRENHMPVWDGEPAYEMMPTSFPDFTEFHGAWMVRKRAYWSLFAGSFGHTYGHCSVWCSISEKEKNPMCRMTWHEALGCEGAQQMRYLHDFIDATQVMLCIPRQDILPPISGEDVLDLHLQACGTENGDTFYVYFPSGGKTMLDVSSFGQHKAYLWWYSPRDGKFYADAKNLTDKATEGNLQDGHLEVSAPTEGKEQDWVLIVKKENSRIPIQQQTYYEFEETNEAKKVFEW